MKAKLTIKDTGNAKVDAMGDIFNAKLALFTDAPPAEQGALGWVNKGVKVAMAVKNFTAIGQELMDTGFAMATAGAKLTYQGRERLMLTPQSTGDCNACHTQNGSMMAPGRITVP